MKILGSTIACFVLLVNLGCVGEPPENGKVKPDIVEVFACGDYCPGPKERYLKRVYDGVTDIDECGELGGRPYTYIGWSTRTICIAE